MQIRRISEQQQQNQQNFGVLKRPIARDVSQYILQHADQPGNEGLQAVIEKVARRERHNNLFDIELILDKVNTTAEGMVDRLFAIVIDKMANMIVARKSVYRPEEGTEKVFYPLVADTLKEASKEASLRYSLNRGISYT